MVGDPLQAAQQVAADVGQILAALADVGVVHVREAVVELLGGLVHRPLGVDLLGADALLHPAQELDVGEQEDVGVEDGGEVVAEVFLGARAQALQLAAGVAGPLAQAGDLPLHLGFGDVKAEDLRAAGLQTDGAADGDAVGDTHSLQHLHRLGCPHQLSSSNRLAMSVVTARTASSSS